MVSGSGSRDLIWQSVRSFADARWCTGWWVPWVGQCMDCVWSKEVRQIEKGRRCTVTRCSLAVRHCPFMIGPRYGRRARSVNRLIWLRMVYVDIRALWRPGVPVTVLVDGLHWSHRCLRRICQSLDSVIPGDSHLRGWFQVVPISCRRYLNHRIFLCGTTICSPQAGLQHTHCPFPVDDGEALASQSLLEWSVSTRSSLQVFTDVQMRGLIYNGSTAWDIHD